MFKRKSISLENRKGQGLASVSDVEKLTRKIPDLRNKLEEIEKYSQDTIVPKLEEILQDLKTYYEIFSNGQSELLEALDEVQDLIDNKRFKSAEKKEYTEKVTDAIEQITCLPDSYDTTRSVVNELKHSQETLPIITSTRKSLAKMEELLLRHESHELGMWYEEARKRTRLTGLYTGFFIILSLFITLIVLTIIFWQGETENYTTWYTAIGQYATLRLALLGAFTGVLWFLGKQISNQKKIYEEYGHKESMMKSFRGFASKLSSMREAISISPELADDTHVKETISNIFKTESELATEAIKIVGKNPADHLSTESSRRKTRKY